MEEKNLLEQLEDLLQRRDSQHLKLWLEDIHANDVAELIDELDQSKGAVLFRALPKEKAVDVFADLSPEAQAHLINGFSDAEVSHMVEELFTDDAVDMVEELPANVVTRVLQLATPETRNTINHYLQYPEDSAGSIMTSEFIRLRKDMNVGEALEFIRENGEDKVTLYTLYITTPDFRLEGVLSMRTLLLAQDETPIADLMQDVVISAYTTADQEQIVHLFSDYDLLTLPVVDLEMRLVGIITIDDVLDVSQEEATEDFERMAAMAPSEKPYLKTPVFEQARNRFTWLLILMISGMINGSILERYEHAFLAIPVLVSFIPMLTDTGGNAGSQSSTMIIRGLALDEIRFKDWFAVLWKELRISLVVGIILAAVNFGRIYVMYDHNVAIASVVSLTLVAVVMMAKVLGSMLPLIAQKLKLDPAIMAAPLITTIVDASALIIFFQIAGIILNLSGK